MDGNTLEWGLFEPNKKQNIVKYKSIAFTLSHVAQVSTGQLDNWPKMISGWLDKRYKPLDNYRNECLKVVWLVFLYYQLL